MRKMINEMWEQIKQFYYTKFGIEPDLVDLVSNFDILKLCASGSDNGSIASLFSLDVELVADIIDKYLGFRGWVYGLPFSPINIYKSSKDNGEFREKIDLQGYFYYPPEIDKMWEISVLVSNMEKVLNEKWI